MYIEAIIQANIKEQDLARVINEINKILETDYPKTEIIQAREQPKPHHFLKIESDTDDWEEMILRRLRNGNIKQTTEKVH